MYRSKDFLLMDVIDINGKKVGFIKDILINFNDGFVIGFSITPTRMFKRKLSILTEDIVTFHYNMIVKKTREEQLLQLSDFKGMDIVDSKGNTLGRVEDIVFDINTFKVKGVVISAGFIYSLLHGKKVFLIKDLILGDESILYLGNIKKVSFSTIPHELLEVENHD